MIGRDQPFNMLGLLELHQKANVWPPTWFWAFAANHWVMKAETMPHIVDAICMRDVLPMPPRKRSRVLVSVQWLQMYFLN